MSRFTSTLKTAAVAFAAVAALAFSAVPSVAGDFYSSSVTYDTPDFTTAGGVRSGAVQNNGNSGSVFYRFPLIAGADYTVTYTSTQGAAMGIYDFTVADGASDTLPSPYVGTSTSGVLATNRNGFSSFVSGDTLTFTSVIDGTGTIELSDYSNYASSGWTYTIDLQIDGVAPVPLPPAAAMLLMAIGGLAVARRQRAKA
ncbi:MAG: hypothetical protein AAFR57_02850 [Pseudomonadota bacterium]